MNAYFVSDIHLKSPTEPKALLLERFLFSFARKVSAGGAAAPTHLFLVGDIFDLWIGSHRYFYERYEKIVDLIRDLVRLGVEVHFFEGNHDLHLGGFWEGKIGVRVHGDVEYFDLGGARVRVEHGDLINPDDKGYRFLRWFLRTPVMRGLALHLPDKLVAAIGEKASAASREYTSGSGAKAVERARVLEMIHAHARRCYQDEPFDLIISGHVHVQDDFSFEAREGRLARSVNLGSWYEGAPVFVLAETAGAPAGKFIDSLQV